MREINLCARIYENLYIKFFNICSKNTFSSLSEPPPHAPSGLSIVAVSRGSCGYTVALLISLQEQLLQKSDFRDCRFVWVDNLCNSWNVSYRQSDESHVPTVKANIKLSTHVTFNAKTYSFDRKACFELPTLLDSAGLLSVL